MYDDEREHKAYLIGKWGGWAVLIIILCIWKPNLMWALFTGFFAWIGIAFSSSFAMLELIFGMFT